MSGPNYLFCSYINVRNRIFVKYHEFMQWIARMLDTVAELKFLNESTFCC